MTWRQECKYYARLVTWRSLFVVGVILGSLLLAGFLAIRSKRARAPVAVPLNFDCLVNGNRYRSGEALPSLDGCNLFGCRDGKVWSTLMGCEKLPDQPRREVPHSTGRLPHSPRDWRVDEIRDHRDGW